MSGCPGLIPTLRIYCYLECCTILLIVYLSHQASSIKYNSEFISLLSFLIFSPFYHSVLFHQTRDVYIYRAKIIIIYTWVTLYTTLPKALDGTIWSKTFCIYAYFLSPYSSDILLSHSGQPPSYKFRQDLYIMRRYFHSIFVESADPQGRMPDQLPGNLWQYLTYWATWYCINSSICWPQIAHGTKDSWWPVGCPVYICLTFESVVVCFLSPRKKYHEALRQEAKTAGYSCNMFKYSHLCSHFKSIVLLLTMEFQWDVQLFSAKYTSLCIKYFT